ncbi:hypothetical protein, partial [Stenotrophomonas maltophilia]
KRAAIREPVLRTGALRSSVNQGTAPNSLRSNSGASSPRFPCGARLATRRTQVNGHNCPCQPRSLTDDPPTKNPAEAGFSA